MRKTRIRGESRANYGRTRIEPLCALPNQPHCHGHTIRTRVTLTNLNLFQIDCCIKLSGMPDLTLTFVNPRLFDDVSFHPCVRFKRWEVSMYG